MKRLSTALLILCSALALHAENTLYTTTFSDWTSYSGSGQQAYTYSGIEFTVNNVKVMPTQTPSGVSGASAGYIQPNTASAMSSSYVQTGLLSNVSTVRFTHAAATVGNGWRLESSSDGVNFYAFNENETGCSTAKVAEEKEVYVFMDNVYLRWTPITTGGNNTSIYLTEITINSDGSGNAGGNPSMGDELTYNITLYAPDACPEMKPGICGTFNSWSTPIPMTLLTDNEGRTYYSYSFQSNPGDAFKIREQNDTDWSNQLQQNVDGNWENFENYTLTDQTEIVLDHSNNSMYRFSQCTDGGNYTYSVVGTANLFGNEWDVTDTRTEMLPYGDHMYAYTIDSVTLRTDGDYQYKVIANHAWNVQEWPSVVEDDNYHINVEDPGVYQVLFLLDPNTGCSATTNYLHAIIEEQPQLTSKSWHISPSSPYDSDNLRLTMAEALSGDTIFLADGIYNESNMNYLAFTKNLLLMAEAGASPVIRPQTPFTISNGANAQMIDIKIDASNLNAANTYDHLIYAKDDNEANGLYMVRCELYNFTNNNSAIYCSSANTLSACFFLDCYIHDMTKTVMFFENESLQQLTISGSTFANITTDASGYYAAVIDARGANTSVYVDHCTFYNCQVMNSDYGAIKASNASDVIVTNSIFAMPESYDTGRSVYANSGTVGFCIMYNYTKDSGLGIHSGPDISNCSSADPMFVDAANGDFTLAAGSPAYSASNEGSAIGDPRWATNAGGGGGDQPCNPISGICGADGNTNVTWLLCDSILTIGGNGAMADYDQETEVPWYEYKEAYHSVYIASGVTNVGNQAFRQSPRLRYVNLESTVTSLGSYAFKGSNMLSSVVLPSSVTAIGTSVFEDCSALAAVNIPDGITTLGEYTFSGCSSLRTIDLPASVSSLASYCFAECTYIESITCRATTPPEANGSTFSGVNYMIPIYVPQSSLEQYPSAEGWSGFTDYRAIVEDPGLCTIASGECGAEGDNVTWELTCDSVMYISGTGAMANYNTNSNGQAPWATYGPQINEIIIEEGVTSISAYGFYNAGSYTNGAYNNVRSVTIPSTVSKVVNNYFYQCPLLTVTINSDTIVGQGSYSSSSNLQNIFGAQVRQYIIGEGVTSIASSAFYNQSPDSLRSIVLPEGITSIGTWAFGYLENMDSITLPAGLQSIGSDAFYGSGLKHITIPAGVTEMGGQAFQNCDKLASVTMQEGLTQIGTSAFANCTALPEITIPESIETIGSGAFTGCTNLTKITVLSATWVAETKSSSSTTKQALGGYVRELVLGGNITTIGKYAFTSLDSLRRVSFPSSLTVIGEYAFSACKSLQSVILPNSVTTIANYAFNGCTALDSIQLSDGLLRIGTSAFYQCTSLSRLTLPESLKAINSTAFYQCTGLTEMIIPSGVDSLGTNIFGGCTNLAKLTINSNDLCSQNYSTSTNLKSAFNQDAIKTYIIGEGVTRIGKYAFYNAPMTALVLPSTLTSVDQGSFGSCTSLTRVTCNAYTPPTLQNNTFTKQDTLFVPCEAKASYRAAQYWSSFSPIMCDGQQDMTFNLTSAWTFLMLPNAFSMSAEDIVIDGEVEWGTYNGSLRAMGRSGWENYDAAAVYMCSQALIVRATNGTATLTFTVPRQATNRVGTTMTLYYHEALHEQNANWNFLGNPYPYAYDIMTALAAQGFESPVTVWNGTAYQMYTPGIDTYVLQPFEAFFLQLPDDGAESLTLSPEYIEE